MRNITTIDSGFENVQTLSIIASSCLTTIDLQHVQLHKFSFFDCPNITVLKGVNSIRCISVGYIPEGFELIPNIPYESIAMSISKLNKISLNMFNHCDLSHLQSLSLSNLYFEDHMKFDFAIFRNIPNLSLGVSTKVALTHFPALSIFNGTFLRLSHFNLQSWTSSGCIPNLKRIMLVSCVNIDPQLSFLVHVPRVSINNINNLRTIVSLSSCIDLELSCMHSLERIAFQPCLLHLSVFDCQNLVDYETDGQKFNQVEMDLCLNFHPLYKFRNSRELIYHRNIYGHDIPANLSFVGYEQSDLAASERIVRIFIGENEINFPMFTLPSMNLTNLQLLDLEISGEILDLSHFHDIYTMQIKISAKSFKEISHLRNIQVLQFTEMNSLQSLHHLENIDKIMLCAFPADFQFDGLKGCRVVYSRGNKRLEEQAELYGRGERDVSLFDSNYLEMFGRIEEFYIVHEYWEGFNWQNLPEYGISRLW